MIAMQYNIKLPSDYDMDIIKKRVRDNGTKTDGFPDLQMKAYLIAEKENYNNNENQYSPFYLWEKEDGMNQFLLGSPFNNILNSFGRPRVHNWMVLHSQINKTSASQYAFIETLSIPVFTDFTVMCAKEEENFVSGVSDTSTTAYITAYNPFSWELCHYHMTTDLDLLKKIARGNLIYDVHHIS